MIAVERHEEFKALWGDLTATQGYIRERLRVTHRDVEETRVFLGLPERKCPVVPWEPTPEEIEKRSAECRSDWTRYGETTRRSSVSEHSFAIKTFSFDRRSMSFH